MQVVLSLYSHFTMKHLSKWISLGQFGLLSALIVASLSSLGFAGVGGARSLESETEVEVLQVKSNYPKGYAGSLFAQQEDFASPDLAQFRFQDNQGANRIYTLEEIRSGIVLVHALNKDLIVLRAKGFDAHSGGPVNLMFYRDFLGSDRREVRFTYQPEATQWTIRTDDSQGRDVFNQLAIGVKTSLGAPTGVSELSLSLDQSPVRKYNPAQLPKASTRAYLFLD